MLRYLLNMLPSSRPTQEHTILRRVEVIPQDTLGELRALLHSLAAEIKKTPTTDIDNALFEQILNLMRSTKHYPSHALNRWKNNNGGYFDPHYIQELKNTERNCMYGRPPHLLQSHLYLEDEPSLPFLKADQILRKIAICMLCETARSYHEVLNEVERFYEGCESLMMLSEAEKTRLIERLKAPDYAIKYERAIDIHIASQIKNEASFHHFVGRILTYTDVDFMMKAYGSSPINIPVHHHKRFCPDQGASTLSRVVFSGPESHKSDDEWVDVTFSLDDDKTSFLEDFHSANNSPKI